MTHLRKYGGSGQCLIAALSADPQMPLALARSLAWRGRAAYVPCEQIP